MEKNSSTHKLSKILMIIFMTVMLVSLWLFALKNQAEEPSNMDLKIESETVQINKESASKITLTVLNKDELTKNDIFMELIIPEDLKVLLSSPDLSRDWNELQSGKSSSMYILTSNTVDIENTEDEIISEVTLYSKIVNKLVVFVPVAIFISILWFVFLFTFQKEGKIQFSIGLIIVLLLGTIGPILYQLVDKSFLRQTERLCQTIEIDGVETTIEAVVKYKNGKTSHSGEEYYVVFDTNSENEIEYQLVGDGNYVKQPEDGENGTNIFAGWYTDKNMTQEFDFENDAVTEDLVLYERWESEDSGWDTDGDEISDAFEKKVGSDPNVVDDIDVDTDGEGVSDYFEQYVYKSDINCPDTDGDGLTDYEEVVLTDTDPTNVDTDGDGGSDFEEDIDEDGLSNGAEIERGTDPLIADSDLDDVSDGDEVLQYKTDPLNDDTDSDLALDGWEIANNTDPLVSNESFHVTKCSEASDSGVTANVDVTIANGNPDSLSIEETVIDGILDSSISGYVGNAYSFSTDGSFDNATIEFTYDPSVIAEDADLAICYYNEDTQLLEPLETILDNGIATAVVQHFSTYILLDRKALEQVWNTDIVAPDSELITDSVFDIAFVIDYSASMDENDPDNLRLQIVKEFIEKLRDNQDQASVIKFAAYATTLVPLTTDKTMLTNAVSGITNASSDGCGDPEAGTNGSDGLNSAIEELINGATTDQKHIIFLTDGEDTSTSYDYEELIQTALDNNITIFAIGMGDADEELLRHIAESTGGKYYFASSVDMEDQSADSLMGAFDDIQRANIDLVTDSNDDGISDYYTKLLCDGALYTGTGISLFNQIPYDDVQENDDYDGDGLKNGEEVVVRYDEETGKTYLGVVSSPVSADTDDDGIQDNEDTAPRKKGLAGGVIGKLNLVSCYNNEDSGWTSGHVFFVYQSYIKDDIDFSGFAAGWEKSDNSMLWSLDNITYDSMATQHYSIFPNECLSVGNGALQVEWYEEIDSLGVVDRSEANGVTYNMEVFKHFSEDYGYSYLNNTYLEQDITKKQFENLIDYCSKSTVSFWSLTHNCAEVACQAWNRVATISANPYSDQFLDGLVATPKGLKINMRESGQCGENYDFSGALRK